MIFRHIVSLSGKTVYFMVIFTKQEVREIFLNRKELCVLHEIRPPLLCKNVIVEETFV
jgi:hypothetical protein